MVIGPLDAPWTCGIVLVSSWHGQHGSIIVGAFMERGNGTRDPWHQEECYLRRPPTWRVPGVLSISGQDCSERCTSTTWPLHRAQILLVLCHVLSLGETRRASHLLTIHL
ncbi:MAG TPA: hypothetical protein VNG51_23175 [Ktedonobacteraceae bacterium]|nr:hypothetical protein [Ktedonobacteraceae bacterium]